MLHAKVFTAQQQAVEAAVAGLVDAKYQQHRQTPVPTFIIGRIRIVFAATVDAVFVEVRASCKISSQTHLIGSRHNHESIQNGVNTSAESVASVAKSTKTLNILKKHSLLFAVSAFLAKIINASQHSGLKQNHAHDSNLQKVWSQQWNPKGSKIQEFDQTPF